MISTLFWHALDSKELLQIEASLLKGAHPDCTHHPSYRVRLTHKSAFSMVASLIIRGALYGVSIRDVRLDQLRPYAILGLLLHYGMTPFCSTNAVSIHMQVAFVLNPPYINYQSREARRHVFGEVLFRFRNLIALLMGYAVAHGGTILQGFLDECLNETKLGWALEAHRLPDEHITEEDLQRVFQILASARQSISETNAPLS